MYVTRIAVISVAMLALIAACATKAEDPIVGRWKIEVYGIDKDNNPCPFVPEEFEFFRDGTVSMTNAPEGMKLYYATSLNEEDAGQVLTKFPYLKDRKHILMMGPSQTDLVNRAMAYDYSVTGSELRMTLPGWTPSRYRRVK